jgi:hypothetical protein
MGNKRIGTGQRELSIQTFGKGLIQNASRKRKLYQQLFFTVGKKP